MNLFSCCVACASRRVGCHSDCERYAEDKAICEKVNKARKAVQANEDAIYEVAKHNKRRNKL